MYNCKDWNYTWVRKDGRGLKVAMRYAHILFFCLSVILSVCLRGLELSLGLEGWKEPQGAMRYTIAHFDILAILYCVFPSLCLMFCLSVSLYNDTDI